MKCIDKRKCVLIAYLSYMLKFRLTQESVKINLILALSRVFIFFERLALKTPNEY